MRTTGEERRTATEGFESAIDVLRRHVKAEDNLKEGIEHALVDGADLSAICAAIGSRALRMNAFAFGGRGAYASALAVGLASATHLSWFRVDEVSMGHDTQRLTEGACIDDQDVVVVDTLTTSGTRLLLAILDIQKHTNANVIGAMPLVDAQDGAEELLAENVPDVQFKSFFTAKEIIDE